MKLNLSEEQALFRDSVERFFRDHYSLAQRDKSAAAQGCDPDVWQEMARLGWLSLPFREDDGGVGLGAVEVALLCRGMGAALALEPFIASVVLAGSVLDALAENETRQRLIGGLIAGALRPALAHEEATSGDDLANVRSIAASAGDGWRISGRKTLVRGGATADQFLVSALLDGSIRLFAVPRDTEGLRVTCVPLADGDFAADLDLREVPVGPQHLIGSADKTLPAIIQAFDRAIAALCADATGAMQALLEATTSYTQQRVQFGKPLSTFQALRHRMAEMAVKCREAQASAQLATLSVDAEPATRIRGVSGAKAKIGQVSRNVAHEAIQLHGAIGFSAELPVGLWFKRLFVFEATFGSTQYHRARYGKLMRDPALLSSSLLADTAEEAAFRAEIRDFLEHELDDDLRRRERLNTSFLADPDYGLRWHNKLADKGWVAPSWPAEYGGPGWTLTQRYIFDQECERAGEPHFRGASIKMIAPVLMRYGSKEQKAFYLPRILSGEDLWAQGYSEPGAGSDLASLTMRARRDGEYYTVNGSKIWSTLAHKSTRMFALVRTGNNGRKQDGITFLLIDLSLPGITIKPIQSICGTHEFNQVFFDDVRVPVSDRVGDEGDGWQIAKYLLEFERGGGFAGGMLRAMHTRVLRLASAHRPDGKCAIDDPLFAARFAEISTDIDAAEMMELGIMSELELGGNPGAVASSTMKLARSRIRQSIAELATTTLGPDAVRWEAHRPLSDLHTESALDDERKAATAIYFNSRSQSIFGGSNEIQLEIIARALLN